MVDEPSKDDFENCLVCQKHIVSLETVSIGDYFFCQKCATPLEKLLDTIANRLIVSLHTNLRLDPAKTLKDAILHEGIRHLDAKGLVILEHLL